MADSANGRSARIGAIIDEALRETRRSGKLGRRHPAEVTSDRLGEARRQAAERQAGL